MLTSIGKYNFMTKQVKSKKRVADHGEVFTAKREVNAMLDLVKQETQRIDSRFLEPACGNGNFLACILERKLDVVVSRYKKSQIEWEMYSVIAVSSIYGVDILMDNVEECRERLFEIFEGYYTRVFKYECKQDCLDSVAFILSKNILWGDALTLKTPEEINAKPIVFSEWSPINDSMIKRKDYTMANLLEAQSIEVEKTFFDPEDEFLLPTPIKEYAPTHFLKLKDML